MAARTLSRRSTPLVNSRDFLSLVRLGESPKDLHGVALGLQVSDYLNRLRACLNSLTGKAEGGSGPAPAHALKAYLAACGGVQVVAKLAALSQQDEDDDDDAKARKCQTRRLALDVCALLAFGSKALARALQAHGALDAALDALDLVEVAERWAGPETIEHDSHVAVAASALALLANAAASDEAIGKSLIATPRGIRVAAQALARRPSGTVVGAEASALAAAAAVCRHIAKAATVSPKEAAPGVLAQLSEGITTAALHAALARAGSSRSNVPGNNANDALARLRVQACLALALTVPLLRCKHAQHAARNAAAEELPQFTRAIAAAGRSTSPPTMLAGICLAHVVTAVRYLCEAAAAAGSVPSQPASPLVSAVVSVSPALRRALSRCGASPLISSAARRDSRHALAALDQTSPRPSRSGDSLPAKRLKDAEEDLAAIAAVRARLVSEAEDAIAHALYASQWKRAPAEAGAVAEDTEENDRLAENDHQTCLRSAERLLRTAAAAEKMEDSAAETPSAAIQNGAQVTMPEKTPISYLEGATKSEFVDDTQRERLALEYTKLSSDKEHLALERQQLTSDKEQLASERIELSLERQQLRSEQERHESGNRASTSAATSVAVQAEELPPATNLQQLQAEKQQLKSIVTTLTGTVAQYDAELSNIRASVAAAQNSEAALATETSERARLASEVERWRARAAASEEALAARDVQAGAAEADLARLREGIRRAMPHTPTATPRSHASPSTPTTLRSKYNGDLEETSPMRVSLRGTLSSPKSARRAFDAMGALDTYAKRMATSEAKLARTEAELAATKDAVTALRNKWVHTKHEAAEARKAAVAAEQANSAESSEATAARAEVARLERALQHVTERMRRAPMAAAAAAEAFASAVTSADDATAPSSSSLPRVALAKALFMWQHMARLNRRWREREQKRAASLAVARRAAKTRYAVMCAWICRVQDRRQRRFRTARSSAFVRARMLRLGWSSWRWVVHAVRNTRAWTSIWHRRGNLHAIARGFRGWRRVLTRRHTVRARANALRHRLSVRSAHIQLLHWQSLVSRLAGWRSMLRQMQVRAARRYLAAWRHATPPPPSRPRAWMPAPASVLGGMCRRVPVGAVVSSSRADRLVLCRHALRLARLARVWLRRWSMASHAVRIDRNRASTVHIAVKALMRRMLTAPVFVRWRAWALGRIAASWQSRFESAGLRCVRGASMRRILFAWRRCRRCSRVLAYVPMAVRRARLRRSTAAWVQVTIHGRLARHLRGMLSASLPNSRVLVEDAAIAIRRFRRFDGEDTAPFGAALKALQTLVADVAWACESAELVAEAPVLRPESALMAAAAGWPSTPRSSAMPPLPPRTPTLGRLGSRLYVVSPTATSAAASSPTPRVRTRRPPPPSAYTPSLHSVSSSAQRSFSPKR
ncbi:hypothetical protein RI054_04g23800 [Pseudoscourfieldia marina]